MSKIAMILSVSVLSLLASDAFSQANNKLKMELGYSLSAPLGSFKNNYISNTSFRGITGEVKYAINPKFSVGLHAGYQDYYQKYGREVYKTQGNETVSAVVSNSMQIVPLIARGTFSPMGGSGSLIQPYVSAGAGVNMVNYSQYLGQFPTMDASANLALQAGAGVYIPFSKTIDNTGLKVGAVYNYGTFNKFDISNLNSVAFNMGVVFNLK